MSPKIKEGLCFILEGLLDDLAKVVVKIDLWLAKKSGKE